MAITEEKVRNLEATILEWKPVIRHMEIRIYAFSSILATLGYIIFGK